MDLFHLFLESISMSKDRILNSVLHVPNLSCNRISISKLTRDLSFFFKFCPTHSKFHKFYTRKRIRCAKEVNGLFIFKEPKDVEKAP